MKPYTYSLSVCSFQRGFSLVELSIVLVIVGLLVGTAAAPLSNSIKHARYKRTTAQLSTIREAMHGYLISTGRLPCPLHLDATQSSDAPATSTCSIQHGAVPAVTLGLVGERAPNGALLDEWGREYLYTVSFSDHEQLGQLSAPDWLTVGEPAAVGVENIRAELQLCRTVATDKCANNNLIASQIAWVVHSRGESNTINGLEAENADNDSVFAVSGYSTNKDQPFDDQIIWASRSELVYWLLKANWLP